VTVIEASMFDDFVGDALFVLVDELTSASRTRRAVWHGSSPEFRAAPVHSGTHGDSIPLWGIQLTLVAAS
jgi:hypothetical protein